MLKSAVVYEQRLSAVSNNEFYISNYGLYGHNVSNGGAGWFWPRSSGRAYIYGQSIWMGAKKRLNADTVKVVSVGYNPNSGSSWFGPGSTADGGRVLGAADPVSAKYYLYMATDFTPQGKNTKTPSLPDWPIRKKQSGKTVGKNGYYGDYIADPASRDSFPAVFISGEDMFCIYKDTDTLRNPEYKFGSGYPLGLDILQTTYSWNSGPQKDFVFFVYTVINRSNDTLRECFLGPAGDSDIGTATNDHNAFYSANPSLNLGFQFTEEESGYSGVVGFDFLESPTVRTTADSIAIFQRTGNKRNVGQQIGLTTFRNWVIENDPTGASGRYDFMAAGVRDADNGPGDKRMLMATGPFTMNPGDSARIVVSILLAPGKGNPISGDVQTNGFLDSLVALDAYAQAMYDNNFVVNVNAEAPLSPATFSLLQNYPNPFNPSTGIRFSVGTRSVVSLRVYDVLGRAVATVAHGEFGAGEHAVTWNGTDDNGLPVSSGVYLYRLESGTFTESRKMLLMR
ncbi:MAG: T9SS type A sorting domain-containing protein [Bacteroidetes bacterium]|nr:T9SS type A sorting domain-containing protein [Bacteroidota bacterium]